MWRQVTYQRVPELTPVSGMASHTNRNYIEVASVIIPAARISFGGTGLLYFYLRFYAVSYGFDLDPNGNFVQRYHGKVMHSVNIMTFVTVQPAFPACNAKLPLEMNFCNRALQGNFEAKSLVDCIKQLLCGEAIFDFKSVGHSVV